MKSVDVIILSIYDIKNNLDYLSKYIDNIRLNKALKYKKENDRLLSIGASYLIKKYTNNSFVYYNKYHKPIVNDIYFNVSHSNEYVVFIKSDYECGIDIEKIEDVSNDLIKFSFDKDIKTSHEFFYYWTLKEAISKAYGSGLSDVDIKKIPSDIGINQYMNKTYYLNNIKFKDYYIGVAINSSEEFNINIQFEIIK